MHGTHTITEEEIVRFAREFDPQAFHTDPEAARETAFGGLIASGWHTAALYMGMFVRSQLLGSASMGSPGVEELRWLVPVRPGDVLTARSRVVEAWPSETSPGRGTIVGEHEFVNQHGEVVHALPRPRVRRAQAVRGRVASEHAHTDARTRRA